MNKCEWKEELVEGSPVKFVKIGLIFHPCERMRFRFTAIRMFPGLCEKVISHGEEVFDYCPHCGADIRKLEPTEPLIVKSGGTWVAYCKRIDYLWTGGDFLKTIEPLFSMTTPKYGQWKSFTGPNPDIIELTDEIAKLRPMCRFISSDPHGQGLLTWKNILVYMDENDYMTRNGTSHSGCKLLTAKELHEIE